MSLKFNENRSVDSRYLHVPIKYCNQVPSNGSKEFVLIDCVGRYYVAAWRNENTCRVGMTFLVPRVERNGNIGFMYKNKFYKLNGSGWVL